MQELAGPAHSSWEGFYVIVGTSAAALTGLQFVVIVLAAELDSLTNDAVRAFGTPTIVHFCAVLLMSATIAAPWHSLGPVAVVLGAFSLGSLLYLAWVFVRARHQTDYRPVAEDWLWHVVLPTATYAILFASALTLTRTPYRSLFGIGLSALLLLFTGIHNAWDSVVYIASRQREQRKESREASHESAPSNDEHAIAPGS
jgi:hypothetical protein